MSRSGYNDDIDEWALIRWRGAVRSAIRGKRGQAFLNEMLAAFDALPDKRLISHDLERDGCVCALGAAGKARYIDMSGIDPEDHDTVAGEFGVAHALACEIMVRNDECGRNDKTPEQRFERMRKWIESQIRKEAEAA